MMRALLLVMAPAAAAAWDECKFPTFDFFSIDEGAGKSWAYTATAMNGNTYLGGYELGHFLLQGVTENDEMPASTSAINLGEPYSRMITLYVAEVSSAAKMEKGWYFKTNGTNSRDNKIIVRGLHHSLDRAHVIAAGYFSDGMETPDGTTLSAFGRLNYAVEPVPFVAKIDVSKTNGVGPGTNGWVVEIDRLGSGFPGGAQIYSVDGFANSDVLVSFAGCADFNSTKGAKSPFSGLNFDGGYNCKHYISKLKATDGTEVWRREMPSGFQVKDFVHGVPVFEEFEPCRVIDGGDFFCAFHLAINETITFTPDFAPEIEVSAGLEPKIGVVKFNNAGNVLWAKATVAAGSVTSMSVNKDGTLLAVAGHDKEGSMRSSGLPGLLARIDTSAGNEGDVLWSDASGYGSHGIRDCVVTWDPTNPVQQVIGFGQITSPTTLTDTSGAKTTLNSQGSYEVFLVSYDASDGTGNWAADGGSSGLDYFFELAMDMDTEAIITAGAIGSNAKTISWGNIKRENVMHCDDSSDPVGDYKSFAVNLKTELTLPYCLDACNSTSGAVAVKAGHCYIDRYCYKHNEYSIYVGNECFKCDATKSQTEWTGPNVTDWCYIANTRGPGGSCKAKGEEKYNFPCMTCDPAKDTTDYTMMPGWQTVGGVCAEITWQEEARSNGWAPCKNAVAAVTTRLRQLKEVVVDSMSGWTRPGSDEEDD